MNSAQTQLRAFARLRGFLRSAETPAQRAKEPVETCELCSVRLAKAHRHLLETSSRGIACACDPCALRFHDVVDGRFKLIPRDARLLSGFSMSDAQWEALAVPINLAFIYFDSRLGKRTALYPSPAGVTESLLPLAAWDELAAANPALSGMRDDVEALLVNRLDEPPTYLAAPIDACYELAGLIRVHWRGLSGGSEVWDHVRQFFERLQMNARYA